MTDRLDGQLLALSRAVTPPPPPRAAFEAIVEHGRVRRRRARFAAAGLAMAAALGTGGLVAALGGDQPDVSTNVGAGPEVNDPDAGGINHSDDVATPDASGGADVCGQAGTGPAGPSLPGEDLAGVGHALEARFPSCFGGIVRTGDSSADIYVVDEVPEVLRAAQEMLPGLELDMLPSDAAMADIRAIKQQIDDDAGQLHAAGIPTFDTGIRIVSEGPRVLIGLSPYTAAAAAQLEESYHADWLQIEEYGQVIPGSG